ncbi:MAG: Rrf2 family transcriptional regulator [Rubrobacteraceae bacterium]|nr:Rrf2 family transcriptional regulator [Rubrobacteraceae bacterium]
MQVSAKSDYALRAALELALTEDSKPLKGMWISESQDIPLKFLENILLELKHAGIVRTRRGAGGGYWLARPPEEVSLAEIIRAVEGPLANVRGEGAESLAYSGAAQPLREVWIAVRANLRAVLESVSLSDLASGELPASVRLLIQDPEAWVRH